MAQDRGPWEPEQPPREAPRPQVHRSRRWVWIGLLVAVAALIFALFKAFPGALSSPADWGWLITGLGFVVVLSASILTPGRIRWSEATRHIAIWVGIVLVLAMGVTFRDDLMGIGQRVRGEFSSSYPTATAPRELVVNQDEDGHFYVMGQVNGQPVRFLVDTGASDTVLSPADARRLDINASGLIFDRKAETANGPAYGAAYTADRVAVGDIAFTKVPLLINQAPMSTSLLGMSFLRRLESFQVKGRKLYLKASG